MPCVPGGHRPAAADREGWWVVTLCADCFEDRSAETLVDDVGNVQPCPACGSTRVSNVEALKPARASRLVSLGDELCGRCGVTHVVFGVPA
jgi:hypothetical protein